MPRRSNQPDCGAILEKIFLATQSSNPVPVEQTWARTPTKRTGIINLEEHDDADFVDAAIGDDHCIGGVVVGHWRERRPRSRPLIAPSRLRRSESERSVVDSPRSLSLPWIELLTAKEGERDEAGERSYSVSQNRSCNYWFA